MPPAKLCREATAPKATRDRARAYSTMSCACSWVSTHFTNDQKRLCLSCTRPPFGTGLFRSCQGVSIAPTGSRRKLVTG
jgi:hypothetical protein